MKQDNLDLEKLISAELNKVFKEETKIGLSDGVVHMSLPLRYPDDSKISISLYNENSMLIMRDQHVMFYLSNYGIHPKNKFLLKCMKRVKNYYGVEIENFEIKKQIDLSKDNIGEEIFKFAAALQQISYSVLIKVIR